MMFDIKRPCVNCPFRKGVGETFQLGRERLLGIFGATAFQCHKTVDYETFEGLPGDKPQQCAGLMSLLHRARVPNHIMQIGERLGYFDPDKLDHRDVYDSLDQAVEAHTPRDTRAEPGQGGRKKARP